MNSRGRILGKLGFVLVSLAGCLAQRPGSSLSDEAYYPLSEEKIWAYSVQHFHPKKAASRITWRVTKVDNTEKGKIFQVWPAPADPDDEAMLLLVTPDGVREVTDNLLLLRFPIKPGDAWSHVSEDSKTSKPATRTYLVVSKGKPCTAGGSFFADCVVIEDRNPILALRTITKYARGIGPVSFEYIRKISGKEVLVSTLELAPDQGSR